MLALVYQKAVGLWYAARPNYGAEKGLLVMSAQLEFDQLVARLEQVFDRAVVDGTDDELFASGYLRGHFDLVVAQLELQEQRQPEAIMPALYAAVEQTRHELAPADQAHIKAMMGQLDAAS
ncbi:YfcL family protein [Pseudidiomarina sp.]|uniref:YfcL family protein n=1 Tax=Pseudidiomarina sp. TaxID=2081707 RepID=UPI00299EC4F2|nr:YfcL family protein [Pseudidiomarina sp.]MDX1705855.1 YfcL family protein [Pseudidiomarina sp.]